MSQKAAITKARMGTFWRTSFGASWGLPVGINDIPWGFGEASLGLPGVFLGSSWGTF